MPGTLPPVTIGIPFYNAEATLLDAVRSVIAQSHQNWELLLVDDGSTDDSLRLAQSINDSRVRVFSDGKNRRLSARLNEIVRLAKYDFIARMDADDLMASDRIERQLRILMKNEDIDLVSTGVVSITDDCRVVGVRCVSEAHAIAAPAVLAGKSGIVHAAVVARKDWFVRNNYDESLRVGQDTNLWIRALTRGDLRARVMDCAMYFYREDGNVTYTKIREAYRIHRQTISQYAGHFPFRYVLANYITSLVKSGIVWCLHRSGRFDVLRARRGFGVIAPTYRTAIQQEIDRILGIQVPIYEDSGRRNAS